MTGKQIIANAIDLAGASLIEKLGTHTATLHYLNAVADRRLELANSSRGAAHYEFTDDEFTAQTGNLADTSFALKPTHVRYLLTTDSLIPKYAVINVVDSIEELTLESNLGNRAVMFTGSSPLSYQLSWAPTETLAVQIYGRRIAADEDELSDSPEDIPAEFGDLISVEIAIHLLAEILLLDGADKYLNFVKMRAPQLEARKSQLERVWHVYRCAASESNMLARPYDVFEDDYGTVIQEEGVWP